MAVGEPSDPLASWLQQRLGQCLVARTPVAGGCIHQAWHLTLADGRSVFAKTNAAASQPLLEAEAQGLDVLARHAPPGLVIPRPLAVGVAGDQAVLVLPWLELESWAAGAADPAAFQLGQALAALHRASAAAAPADGYGWPTDNFIGSGPQHNGWRRHWGVFFAECRLAPQLDWAARRGQPLRAAQELVERVPAWLAGHGSQPVLVHGDLWCGNAGRLADGRATLFDPACYWGDREVDLAMAQLFGGFPPTFFRGYAQGWPLEPGAQRRVELYNLYHLLNHANLFGGGYGRRAQSSIDDLLARGV
jgi:fructosamine-3-kinase